MLIVQTFCADHLNGNEKRLREMYNIKSYRVRNYMLEYIK